MSKQITAAAQFLLRPCAADDLPALERFAAASPVGITTLPHDRAFLTDRLQRSIHAFATEDVSGEEIYLFALEELATGNVIGISGIAARAGFSDRSYSFRNEFVVHSSKPLGVSNRIHTLHLCHDLSDVTLLISFHIDPAFVDTLAPQLLSRARLLFIAQRGARASGHGRFPPGRQLVAEPGSGPGVWPGGTRSGLGHVRR